MPTTFAPGKFSSEGILELIGNSSVSAVKIMGVALFRGLPKDLQHHVGPGHLPHFEKSAQPSYPNSRTAVGDDERSAVDNAFKVRVDLRLHNAMHSGDADIAFVTTREQDSTLETARSMLVAWTLTPRMLTLSSVVGFDVAASLCKISHP